MSSKNNNPVHHQRRNKQTNRRVNKQKRANGIPPQSTRRREPDERPSRRTRRPPHPITRHANVARPNSPSAPKFRVKSPHTYARTCTNTQQLRYRARTAIGSSRGRPLPHRTTVSPIYSGRPDRPQLRSPPARFPHAPEPDAAAPRAAAAAPPPRHRRRQGEEQRPGGVHGVRRGGVPGGGPDGAVRAVRGRAGARLRQEGVPRVRPGGGHRGGVEPGAGARAGGARPLHGRPPPRRGAPPPLPPPRAHHRLSQGLARPRRRRAQLHHRGLQLREPPRVPRQAQARLPQGAQEVGAPDPRGPRPPPHPRPLHHPPRPQLQQRLHQRQHRPGEDRRPRAGGDRGQGPHGAHDPGHARVHGAGALLGDVHGVGGHLLVWDVRAGDGDAGDALRRVRECDADLPQRHQRRAAGRAPPPQGPGDAGLHPALHRQAAEPPLRRRPPAGPFLRRHRRRHHRHAQLAAPGPVARVDRV